MFGNKVLDESIRANVDTKSDETFGIQDARAMFRSECGAGVDHMLRKPGILLEDVLETSQDLKRHAHLGFDVPIVSKSKRRACGYFASVRPRKWRVVRLNTYENL